MKSVGALGALTFLNSKSVSAKTSLDYKNNHRRQIFDKVAVTPFIDTHEHLIEENNRFLGSDYKWIKSDDWTMLFSHYLNDDMHTSGMPPANYSKFFSPKVDPIEKWRTLEPYWPYIKNTGYGKAVQISIKELYGVDDLSERTIVKVQLGYEKIRRPGFYKYILQDVSNIKSCHVNSLEDVPFMESNQPLLLMQDISIVGMFAGPQFELFGPKTGIDITSLDDWHRVIDWWFATYGKYAVAVKSQNAYYRDINYDKVSAEQVVKIFDQKLNGHELNSDDQKLLEDHLFWYAIQKATEYNLPVKLHTGYYAGYNKMPLSRLINNPGSATELCILAPGIRFIFMHICYPYYEEILSVAKQFTNAYVDMCWSWIINPVAAKDFLKKYLVTAPTNKILTFGGDYFPVEPIVGHAAIARNGIALALSELVEDSWLTLEDALNLVEPIMYRNAECIFNLKEKRDLLKKAPWS